VAGADQLPRVLAVGDRALLVRVDRRVREEFALLLMYQDGRLPCLCVREGEGRTPCKLGLRDDGLSFIDLQTARDASRGRRGFPALGAAIRAAGCCY
jgi:hypothetical protein